MKNKLIICLLLFLTFGLSAQDSLLYGNFWCNVYEATSTGLSDSLTTEQQKEQVINEATEVFSGMIYGYNFEFVPKDIYRKVPRSIKLSPIQKIQNSVEIKLVQAVADDETFTAICSYRVSGFELKKLDRWKTSNYDHSTGFAKADIFSGSASAKKAAFEDALIQSLISYYSPRSTVKPAKVTGRFSLYEPPRWYMSEGMFKVNIRIIVESIEVVPLSVLRLK